MGAEEFVDCRTKIHQHLTSKPDGLQQIRTNEAVAEMEKCKDQELKSNARTQKKGVHLPSRAREDSTEPIVKSRSRGCTHSRNPCSAPIPYIVALGVKDKRSHPLPTQDNYTGTRIKRSKNGNVTVKGLEWDDLKDLLMADEERLWTLENPNLSVESEFDSTSFVVRREDVEFVFEEATK
jgi:hypothetical protein